jgi:hypothetical protein
MECIEPLPHHGRTESNQPTHLVWVSYNHEMCGISCHPARRVALSPALAYAHDLDCEETVRSCPEHRDELVPAAEASSPDMAVIGISPLTQSPNRHNSFGNCPQALPTPTLLTMPSTPLNGERNLDPWVSLC